MATVTNGSQVVRVEFPKAKDVMVLGSFNNWSTTATPMKAIGGGLWEARLPGTIAPQQVCFFVWDRQGLAGRVVHYESLLARAQVKAPEPSLPALPTPPTWPATNSRLARAI